MSFGFSSVDHDIMVDIFGRLPGKSFAAAACASKTWNQVCNQVLSKPKLVSALSLKPSLREAVEEVFDKVHADPIRPDFAIAYIGQEFDLDETHQIICNKLRPKVPIVTVCTSGIIGTEVETNKLEEVNWEDFDSDDDEDFNAEGKQRNCGIALMVGCLPGVKVEALALLQISGVPHKVLVDKFIKDIQCFSSTVSNSSNPAAIMLFADEAVDMNPILTEMDFTMSKEIIVVGGANESFMWRNGDDWVDIKEIHVTDVVALVFATDRQKSREFGEIQFHAIRSRGVIQFGPQLKVVGVEVKDNGHSWITAKTGSVNQICDARRIVEDFYDQFDDNEHRDLFVKFIRKQEQPNDPNRKRVGCKTSFYKLGYKNLFFIIRGTDVKPGDMGLLYYSDSDTALSTSEMVSDHFRALRYGIYNQVQPESSNAAANRHRKQVMAGFIFTSKFRGDDFFVIPHCNSSAMSDYFPEIPITGAFSSKEFIRGSDLDEDRFTNCCVNAYSVVYLVVSHVTPSP